MRFGDLPILTLNLIVRTLQPFQRSLTFLRIKNHPPNSRNCMISKYLQRANAQKVIETPGVQTGIQEILIT